MHNGADNSGRDERFARIVAQILRGEAAGQEALYEEFERGVRFFFAHQLRGEDAEDKMHDTFLAVITAIRGGGLREPARLAGFLHTIAHRQLAEHLTEVMRRKTEPLEAAEVGLPREQSASPEQETIVSQRLRFAQRILHALPEIDRQILRRFYFEGQLPERICAELRISKTQFRLRKHRAKQRFVALTREALKRKKPADEVLLRKGAAAGH
ncbi:MAG TPA: sigma-70 family RNA polymerase sigma factor [Bryobacterales bacterium]|nr:sigma-70 family RNA polymerase sigma factor [Bryobacterales bacterium]